MTPDEFSLASRSGLPDDLLDLLRKFPRDAWADDPGLRGLAEMWLQRHGMFRELSTIVGRELGNLRAGSIVPQHFLPRFRRCMGLLLGELDAHHNIEDQHYFPAFAAAAPGLRRGFEILDADHHVIHDAILELGGAGNALIAALSGDVSGRSGDPGRAAEDLARRVEGFDRALMRHLDDEEDLIIPLILERVRDDPAFR